MLGGGIVLTQTISTPIWGVPRGLPEELGQCDEADSDWRVARDQHVQEQPVRFTEDRVSTELEWRMAHAMSFSRDIVRSEFPARSCKHSVRHQAIDFIDFLSDIWDN